MSARQSPLQFSLLFVGIWSLVTLVFDGLIVVGAYRQINAESYPVVPGTITYSQVTEHRGDDSTTYGVDLKYSYKVDGLRYEGTRYRYGQMNSSDNSAQKIVNSMPVGKQVDVHYNPAEPDDSVLVAGIQSSDLFLALFLTPFNVIMLGGWYAILVMLFPGIPKLLVGGPRVIRRGVKRRLVLQPAPRVVPAAFVLGISSFLSIFVIAFGFGFSPPMTVIKVVWAIVLGLATATLLRRPRFSLVGKGLVIDEMESTLSIIADKQTKAKQIVPLRSVIDVDAAGEGNRYEVALTYGDDQMSECREVLIQIGDRERAESLAGWLKTQILEPRGRTSR